MRCRVHTRPFSGCCRWYAQLGHWISSRLHLFSRSSIGLRGSQGIAHLEGVSWSAATGVAGGLVDAVYFCCLFDSLSAACWLHRGRGRTSECGRSRGPSCRRSPPLKIRKRAAFILWLILSPCQGVQIWQQGSLQGQPVFTTSSVQPAASVQDLRPVRTPNAPIIELALRAGSQALRTIGVYRPQEPAQPTVLISDDRAYGQLLHKMVCSAYGLAESEWHLRRLVEALPSLPPEQYVLSPAQLPWDQVLVPVDLRPLQGRVRLQLAHRCLSCGDIAERAIQSQHLGPCPVTLCRTSQGWFHPTARLLLLPYGDAFQVWPMHRVPSSALTSQVEEDEAPATLEDRFSTSLSLPTTGELAFHDLSGANAVILHAHGHTYACVPSYTDHLTLRSSALSAVAADLQIQPRGQLFCARLLPPWIACRPFSLLLHIARSGKCWELLTFVRPMAGFM